MTCGRYRLAYVDNQLALSLHRDMPTVYAANSRISGLLKELEGQEWRTKLPRHPDQQRITAALACTSATPTPHTPPTPSAASHGGGSTTTDTCVAESNGSRPEEVVKPEVSFPSSQHTVDEDTNMPTTTVTSTATPTADAAAIHPPPVMTAIATSSTVKVSPVLCTQH